MNSWVLGLREIEQTQLELVGGKGLHLGELSKLERIQVPEGFCVTTAAFQAATQQNGAYPVLVEQLSVLKAEDRDQIGEISRKLRQSILDSEIPSAVEQAVTLYLSRHGEDQAYAVRSSATAEDLPHASFAGQQDTYLNIIGAEAVLQHIRKCWASLFTDRAVIYRLQNGFDSRHVSLAVIVQEMVFPEASGILFTVDPATSNRKVVSIDAGFGLGEALVSGLVSPDGYKVRDGEIIEKRIAAKQLAIFGRKEGGTETREIAPDRQTVQALTDSQIIQLAEIGRQIEARFGCPQDIEWGLAEGTFYILQSRPITTLFPIPLANDQENHIYLSVGHQQMMTDAMKPLGLSFYLLTTTGNMLTAGGRLFVDVAPMLASSASRDAFVHMMGKFDPLIKDIMMTVLEREDFIKPIPAGQPQPAPRPSHKALGSEVSEPPVEYDPVLAADLIKRAEASIEELSQTIPTKSGPALLEFILEDLQELKRILFDSQGLRFITDAMDASVWINQQMYEWLGEKSAVDTLSQSVPHNVTSEMGLALLDVADGIRPYPPIVDYLQHARDDTFLEELPRFEGGREVREAILAFLRKYGMRCTGEIDISRTRWSEKPVTLLPIILSNVKNFEPGEGNRRFEQGRQEALEKERELLDRLKALPDGEHKARETKRRIDLIRNFSGYREFPKYGMISRYFIYKQALLREAEGFVQAGIIQEKEDIFYLRFEELQEVVRTRSLDYATIVKRKAEYALYERLTPPRVMTSDGEILTGRYKREDLPAGAMVGLPVSAGVTEGRARVLFRMEDAVLEEGDILVTPFTDPSWTPLFVSIQGLVTEVGGLMTHGAVIAREYGLPAVVGVENATKRIKDGQRIRVNGTEGYIELL